MISRKKKLKELLKKEKKAEAEYKFRLSKFRGVAHESASGELAYSELKVREDYLNNIKKEIAVLQAMSKK